jgi:hypothetical protein
MKILAKVKDGGPESKVTAYFLIEWKGLFSIALLRFDLGSREAFHTHAFNCVSWVLSGFLSEHLMNGSHRWYRRSLLPVVTRRDTFHQVYGWARRSWVLTFRGPWSNTWTEYLPREGRSATLTHGRQEVSP